jgi:hypothetical protein
LITYRYQFPVCIILVCLGALRRAALVALAEVVVGCVHFATFQALAFFIVVVFAVALSVAVVVVCAFVLDTVFFALGVASIE